LTLFFIRGWLMPSNTRVCVKSHRPPSTMLQAERLRIGNDIH
jgi:hypothetical protein